MGRQFRGALQIVAAACCAVAGAHAQARPSLAGDPPLVRHTPDVEAYPSNFALTQDARGVVYVANKDGVLIYDGERWELLRLPNRDLVRTLSFDGGERVYVGGFDQFGYIGRDAAGREVFHDLTSAFAPLLGAGELFEDIWDVHIAPEGVFFRALRHVFLYEPASGATRLWRHAGRFGDIVQLGSSVVLQFRGEGLKHLVNGEWQLLPGSEPLGELVWDFLHLPDGALLTLAADGRWRTYRDGRVRDYPVPRSFPASSAMSEGVELADGTLAMVSDDGFVYTLNPHNGAHRRFRVDPGYLNDVIVARGGGLLIASEDSVLHLEWPAPWTMLGEAYGLSSTLRAMTRWDERWYALTASGAFALEDGADAVPRFRPLEWTAADAWDLLRVDAKTALLAETYAVKLVAAGKVRDITHSALYPRVLWRSRFDASVVFVGLDPGIAVLRGDGLDWRLTLEEHAEGLSVLGMAEPEARVLWLGSDRGGIWRVRFAPNYAALEETRRFGPADGITYGELPGASVTQSPDGTLIATTNTGVFRWAGERFEPIDLSGLDRVREKDEWLELAFAPDGTRWAYSYKHIYRETRSGWHREEIGAVRRGAIESVTFDEVGAPLFSTTHGVLRFDGMHAPPADGAPGVLLRAVERRGAGGAAEALAFRAGTPLSLPHGDYGLLFRFALPEFRRPSAVRYATRLIGLDGQRSEWSDLHTLHYPRLPPGDYTLEVVARDSLGRESRIEPLRLVIVPAWYASGAARTLWLVLGVIGLTALTAAVVRWRTLRLERLVAARTSELRAANERLDALAHIDGLTGVSNRRELDRHLEEVWALCQKENRPLSVLAIDVDNFKRYNDQHGHLAGDEMLVRLVRVASACIDSRTDLLARFGGDEFFAVRVGADRAMARELAETIRKRIEGAGLGATVSVGIATSLPRRGGSVRDLVRAADAALYTAKATGRNRVAVA